MLVLIISIVASETTNICRFDGLGVKECLGPLSPGLIAFDLRLAQVDPENTATDRERRNET
jgi:hypothetical protein